nr:hypothetical protein CQNTEFLM_CQNTEFLM_CDS_0015 [uncultured phage]
MNKRIILNRDPVPEVPTLSIPYDRKVIKWLDNHYEHYIEVDLPYEESDYNPSFVDFLENGYTIDQLKVKGAPNLFGFQDKSMPVTQKVNNMKNDIDFLGAYAQDQVNMVHQDMATFKAAKQAEQVKETGGSGNDQSK